MCRTVKDWFQLDCFKKSNFKTKDTKIGASTQSKNEKNTEIHTVTEVSASATVVSRAIDGVGLVDPRPQQRVLKNKKRDMITE